MYYYIFKAYTSQFIALVLIALQIGEDKSSTLNRRAEIIDGLNMLPGQIKNLLNHDSKFLEIAKKLKNEKNLLLIGRGYQAATCLEGALKIKEVSYIHSEGILSGELKHGTLALVDETMPILFIMTRDGLYTV